ncbi:helix-turn-helix domain-containing protein [Adhaeribacter terrigena]|uniref:helix-turn-helix domain-containing protein n=1 Tax=Adhaeribacter terrigena TaxID=2793070 RepID=UPI001F2187E7|nr:AraC family transcriptional regulator [Adhaeribacter terrigena]
MIRTELERLNIAVKEIQLGTVEFMQPLMEDEFSAVKTALEKFGFEIIQDQKSRIVEQIKTLVIDLIRYSKEPISIKYSEFLARETGKDYSMLSNLFSGSENITIEKYIILQKIEYVKELLTYDELSLSQIAAKLSYSDLGYLSRQFKEITGKTPTEYKKQRFNDRKPLNDINPD